MKYQTKETLKYVGISTVFIIIVILACMHSCNVWEECRETHSIPYCMAVIGK